uniref:Reticulophagy regulator family member 3 n=1 Tax=Scleropages formosus TaxID=113540 RepID=A0A8D0CHF4_SCLFO
MPNFTFSIIRAHFSTWGRRRHSAQFDCQRVMNTSPSFVCFLNVWVLLSFRFVALSSFRPLFLVCSGLIVAVCVDTWRNGIWPKIRCEDGCSGTLNLSELSNHIAEVCISASCFARGLVVYRRRNPGQFCFLACCFFTFLAAVGYYIPGLVLSYSAVLLLLLYPLAVNHRVWQRLSARLEPALWWLNFSNPAYMMSKPKECECQAGGIMSFKRVHKKLDLQFMSLDNLVLVSTDYDQSDTVLSYADNTTVRAYGGHIPLPKGSEDSKRQSDPKDPGAPELAEFPSVSKDDNKTSSGYRTLNLSGGDSSSTAPMEAPVTATFSSLNGGSLSNIQPYAFAGTHSEGHSCMSTGQRYSEQPNVDPDLEGEDFEMLDRSELHHMDSLGQKVQ